MSDKVWIHSIVEASGYSEDYISIDADEWAAMTEKQQDDYRCEVAVTHQNEVAPCGASVVDESEVPEMYRDDLE